jgi:hypothetical protein
MTRYFRSICPPGVLCVSTGWAVLSGIFIIFIAVAYFMSRPVVRAEQQLHIQMKQPPQQQQQQPLRDWMSPPEMPPRGGIASIPINIPTQGLPESFQSIGIVNAGDKILPLYGRRTLNGSDRWNYYTRTDTYNPVPLPVRYHKRDCMDSVGCDEIMSGDSIMIDALRIEGKTDIYKMDGPKYIPGLL